MKKDYSFYYRLRVWGIVFLLLLSSGFDAGAVFFEKKYLIRQVDGKDVLCDPYVVQRNDYVTLLLKQRGEIAYRDFPTFLEIFRSLNPHVPDVNTIFPSQRILIPLKILPPGSVAGQSSGTVSMPVITITNLPETLKKHSTEYKVQYGDWVAKLISERFGAENTESFRNGLEMFKQLNPEIHNINVISAGQEIRLPEPSIKNTPLYSTMFESTGKTGETPRELPAPDTDDNGEQPPGPEPLKTSESKGAAETPSLAAEPEKVAEVRNKLVEPEKTVAAPEKKIKRFAKPAVTPPAKVVPPLTLPLEKRVIADMSVFRKVATILDAKLLDKGEYYFPRPDNDDLRLTLSETPLMVFDGGVKLLFIKQNRMSGYDQKVIESQWAGTRIVNFEVKSDLRSMIEAIVPLIDPDGYENNLPINDRGIALALRGQYIYDHPGRTGKVCLNILDDAGMRVPGTISDYLKTHGVTIRDWVEGKTMSGWTGETVPGRYRVPEMSPMPVNPAAFFVERLSGALGYPYQKDIEISFPYAGFQVNAMVHMLSFSAHDEVLVDYGDLGGEAIDSIQKTGFRVVQVVKGADLRSIVEPLSRVMPVEVTADPIFWTSRRPRIYNPSIRIPGFLVTAKHGERTRQVLITNLSLPEQVAAYLADSGILLMRVLD